MGHWYRAIGRPVDRLPDRFGLMFSFERALAVRVQPEAASEARSRGLGNGSGMLFIEVTFWAASVRLKARRNFTILLYPCFGWSFRHPIS